MFTQLCTLSAYMVAADEWFTGADVNDATQLRRRHSWRHPAGRVHVGKKETGLCLYQHFYF